MNMSYAGAQSLFIGSGRAFVHTDHQNDAAAGYTHKYGAYKAGYVTVSKMLHNPIYIGMIKNGDDYVSGIMIHNRPANL